MKHLESTAVTGPSATSLAERLLDGVLAEAPPGELARRPRPGPPRGHDQPRPARARAASAATAFDGRLAGRRRRARGATGSPRRRDPARRGTRRARTRSARRRRDRRSRAVRASRSRSPACDAAVAQPTVELGRRLVAPRNGAQRRVHGAGAAQLTGELRAAGAGRAPRPRRAGPGRRRPPGPSASARRRARRRLDRREARGAR